VIFERIIFLHFSGSLSHYRALRAVTRVHRCHDPLVLVPHLSNLFQLPADETEAGGGGNRNPEYIKE